MKTYRKNTLHTIAMACVAALVLLCSACNSGTNMQREYPSWKAIDTSDLESSMTITGVIPSSLQENADTTDLVAAFSGNECWGVTTLQMINGTPYFFLYINRPLSASNEVETTLTLRYYCTKTRYMYVKKDAVTFTVDGHLGTVEEPYLPTFSME